MGGNTATVSDGRTDSDRTVPRAVLHKQILDLAEQRPNASMEAIAEEISFATTTLVERVLDEYGDPGVDEEEEDEATTADADGAVTAITMNEEQNSLVDRADETIVVANSSASEDSLAPETATNEEDSDEHVPSHSINGDGDDDPELDPDPDTATNPERDTSERPDSTPNIDPSHLTEKQRETLEAIIEQPTATQAELADELGVASATINQRVNSIDGFDWTDRQAFAETVIGRGEASADGGTNVAESQTGTTTAVSDTMRESNETEPSEDADSGDALSDRECDELAAQVQTLSERFETLEERLDDQPPSPSVLTDPELAHKVVHACLTSDQISEEEELEILDRLLSE